MKTYLLTFLLFFAFIAAHAQGTLLRGPYLQVATPTSIVIRWRTDKPSESVVKIGSSSQSLGQTFADNTPVTEHEVKVTGLQAETRYYYSIGSQSAVLQTGDHNYFQTSAVAGKPGKYRFGLLGDCGTNSIIQDEVRARMMDYLGSNYMNAWLLLGDNAYSFGRDAEYQSNFFNRYKDNLLKMYPLFPSPGNHDYDNDNPARQDDHQVPYYDVFTMPTKGEAGGEPSGTEAFYSFDYGNVHFLSLDSYGREDNATRLYDTLGRQVQWIKKDLAVNKNKDWVVAYWHHPPYSKGSRESDGDPEMTAIRQNFIRILERLGVDLIICGHSHVYERSRLMGGHYGYANTFDPAKHVIDASSARYDGSDNSCPYIKNSPQSRGTVYVVAGSGGQLGNPKPDWPHKAMYHSDAEHGGGLMMEVEGNRLDLKWIAADGVIRDKFTMEKGVNKETTQEIARDQSIELKASFLGDYLWSNGAKTRAITVKPTENTDYTVKDAQNCIQDVFHVKVPAPKPDPATFIGFNAKKDEKNLVTLSWATSAENELAYFAVQRSTDAQNFTQIAKVSGGPNSQQNKNYTFEDQESPTLPVNTQYYYRVVATAADGRLLYTAIMKVSLFEIVLAAEPNLSLEIEIIPNPSSASQMQIRTTGLTTQLAELTLTDVSGRILNSRKMTISQTPAAFLPNQLTTGIYFLKVNINGRSTVKKLAIQ
ncbi:metallophosphoesterase [Dyadobacter jiangsuensis]|uniref:Putative secreted protein (Por secretion system target) n=1 Tax=Dyadobacter jiangsuensis TaxID=1591085 RepID=A0A2P8G974_9BACT|nr:metallophosphoesterase [Dyadobacter jiangsuensis]PSL30425.1 putative secreted protein (Por secretion system target) [Dyadobacter jiangsuensis]